MGCISGFARHFWIIGGSIILIAGLVSIGRGVYLHLGATELSEHIVYQLLGITDFYKIFSIKFISLGCLMVLFSYTGCGGAENEKQFGARSACISVTILNIYNLYKFKSQVISKTSYVKNHLFYVPGIETELFGGNVYADIAIQISALLSELYLMYQYQIQRHLGNEADTNVILASDSQIRADSAI